MKIRIGTRSSRLARVQVNYVMGRLEAAGHTAEEIIIQTVGDQVRDRAFAQVGAPGVFVREIERALLANEIDLAVHSCKDLPSKSPAGLLLAAIPERVDPADMLLATPEAHDPDAEGLPLKQGARIGTAAARREALLKHVRPDLQPTLLRGNLPTRIRRLREGKYDAILLAAAGLMRIDRAAENGVCEPLDREGIVETRLEPTSFVPAPSQGALALQTREDDPEVRAAVEALDDPGAHRAVLAERILLARVEGGCQAPFGAWCRPVDGDALELLGALEVDGRLVVTSDRGTDPATIAESVWAKFHGGSPA